MESIATQPEEIDLIIRRVWKRIDDGNPAKLANVALAFMNNHRDFMFTAKAFNMNHIITGSEMKHARMTCSKPAHGPDGWEPAEMAMLSDGADPAIADLLNRIEDGAAWPDGICTARAAFLEKDRRSRAIR